MPKGKQTVVSRRLAAIQREMKALVRAAWKAGHAAGQLSMTAEKCERQRRQRLDAANAWYERNKNILADRRYKAKRPKPLQRTIAHEIDGHVTSRPDAPLPGDDNRTAEEVLADYERAEALRLIEKLRN